MEGPQEIKVSNPVPKRPRRSKVSKPVLKRLLERPKAHTLCPKGRWRDQSLIPFAQKAAGETKVSYPVPKRPLERPWPRAGPARAEPGRAGPAQGREFSREAWRDLARSGEIWRDLARSGEIFVRCFWRIPLPPYSLRS